MLVVRSINEMNNQLGVPSSALVVCAHGSSLDGTSIIDEDYFSMPDRHKFMDLVHKYRHLDDKRIAIDAIIDRNFVHKNCKVCIRLVCIYCFRFVSYDRSDFLEPYCYRCEKFFHCSH